MAEEADRITDYDVNARIEVVLLDTLRRVHHATDDALVALCEARAAQYPGGIPQVTPEQVRTARASLVRKGLVRAYAYPDPEASEVGHWGSQWQLAPFREAA